MAVGHFEVVSQDAPTAGRAIAKVALFNKDGSPWSPEGGGEPASIAWGDVTGKPTTFTPAAHTHSIEDIDGLQEALDGKADAE